MLDDAHGLASLRDAIETEDLDRLARQGLSHPLAREVVHRPHPAEVGAGNERVADLERSAQDEDGHHRSTTRVEL